MIDDIQDGAGPLVAAFTFDGALAFASEGEEYQSRSLVRIVQHQSEIDYDGRLRTSRQLSLGAPGEKLIEFHRDSGLEMARRFASTDVYPTRASYIYYEVGDYFGPHQDVPQCDVTLIIPLTFPSHLTVYPSGLEGAPTRIFEQYTRSELPGAIRIDYQAGNIYGIRGGRLLHSRRPASISPEMVAVACYSALIPEI